MLGQKDHIVAEMATRIFADLADPQTINRLKGGAWKESLWQTLDNTKLPLAWVPERLGGSGASLAEGFAILSVAGRFALAVPLAETLAAGWLLAKAGLEAPPAAMTVAPTRPHERITMDADGRLNGRVSVDVEDCRLSEGHNPSLCHPCQDYERGKPETAGGGDFCQARHPHAALAFSLSAAQSRARP